METPVKKDRSHWPLETMSFKEAETQTREYWHNASSEERLNALESLREQLYGDNQSIPRLQRFLSLVPQT